MPIFWWRKKRKERSRRSDPYKERRERARKRAEREKQVSPEEMVADLNYGSDESPDDQEEGVRGAWGILAAIFGIFASIAVIGVMIFVGTRASEALRTRKAAPMVNAAAEGNLPEVTELVERGIDPNVSVTDGGTPLIAAVRHGHDNVVEALLNAGAEPTQDAIDAALRYERHEMVLDMVEAGADPDTRNTWSTKSLLELATERDDVESVRVLLEHGADPNQAPGESPFSTPALQVATRRGNVEIVRLLLEHGADPMVRARGWTALEIAHNLGHSQIEEMMVETLRERSGGEVAGSNDASPAGPTGR